MGNTSLDYSGDTFSGGCLKDVDKTMLVEGQGLLLQVVEDVRVEKVINGCTDLACAMMENEGRVYLNNSLAKTTEGCFNKYKTLLDNLEENIEKSNQNDLLAKAGEITTDESVDSHTIMLHSNSSNSRNDSSQVDTDVNLSLERSLVTSSKKKLLVLDLTGLIAEIIRYVPERHTPDEVMSMKARDN